jgi:hypothetical protein
VRRVRQHEYGPGIKLCRAASARARSGFERWRIAPRLPPAAADWARRKTCNRCNSARDGLVAVKGATAGTTRAGAGGGFREVDDEEEARRKRARMESKQETESRKAEKRKCDFCKRFACIC